MLDRTARWLLRQSFIRFAMVGAAGYLVDAAILALTTGPMGMNPYRGRAIAIVVAMMATWVGNRYFTFAHRRARGSLGAVAQEALKFAGTNMVGATVSYGVYAALVRFATEPWSNLFVAQIVGVLAGLVFNFTLSRTLVFTNRR